MSAVLVLRGQEYPVAAGQSLASALESAGLQPESYLAVLDGQMVPMDTILHAGERVNLVPVMSGG